ncbi:MAG: hypothetical protein JST21_10355 [Bacteroidetes bacterium]|nr:hypothetical protein [Bacteroidota bacterium]
MNKQIPTPGLLFGLIIFIGLMPLTFMFSQNGAQLLLDTSFRYIVWCGQVIILFVLLFTNLRLSKKQLIGLPVLYTLIPFIFTFNDDGLSFLILNKYTSSILSWAIASVLFGKLFFRINFKPSH